jgi:transposase
VINGILHRVRTGVQWRDLPERFGPWKTWGCRERCRRGPHLWGRNAVLRILGGTVVHVALAGTLFAH